MKKVFLGLIVALFIGVWVQGFRQVETSRGPADLPEIVFLGDGGSYTVPPGYNFIVKRLGPFRFVWEPGPTYSGPATERIWRSFGTDGAPPALYHDEAILDTVEAGCVVGYVVLDDDIDGRINYFRVNGNIVHTLVEGMVSQGQFVVPEDGVLSYDANDSSGLYIDYCISQDTPTPTATETALPTDTPTATPTATATISATATVSITSTMTPTATGTAVTPTPTPTDSTPTPSLTPTATDTLVTPTMTRSPVEITETPTPTKEPRKLACLRINFDVSGHEARAGTYAVHELGGRHLVSWYAEDGWKDSGWIRDIDISFPSVYVEVWFTPAGGGDPLKMNILNPAPETTYGWLSRGACHALEVGWPEVEIPDTNGGPANTDNTVWPDQQPTKTPQSGGSLSR